MLPPPTTSLGNLSSLDITNDEELPTDPSNSSDTQEESECCFRPGDEIDMNIAVERAVLWVHVRGAPPPSI